MPAGIFLPFQNISPWGDCLPKRQETYFLLSPCIFVPNFNANVKHNGPCIKFRIAPAAFGKFNLLKSAPQDLSSLETS